jgi:hypothetical protein
MQKRILIFAPCLFLLLSSVAWGQDARITDVIVTNTRDDLILFFRVQDCFTQDLEKAILNGVPTAFTFLASLDQVRNFWKDKNMASLEIRPVTRSEHSEKSIIVSTLSEAKKIMAEVENVRIAELKSLERNCHYQVSVKAELSKITLPFYLHHVFRFFLFLWDFETDWHTTDFIY